jgi:hypothetical protein
MRDYKKEAYDAILKKGTVPKVVLDQMTFNEMLKHLLTYSTTGEIWYPGVKS